MNDNNKLNVQPERLPEQKTLSLNGYEIHYNVYGKMNKDFILFLHPAFSDHRAFDQQIDYFSKNFGIITIDLIGHGLSKAKNSKDQIDASSEHICKILELEGIDKVNIVGVSVGSLIAQYFALHYPEKIKSITALGGYDINYKKKEVGKGQRTLDLNLIIRALFSMKAFRRKIAEVSCNTEVGKALFYATTDLFERSSFKVMQGLQRIVKNRKRMKRDYPILILSGEFDIEIAKKMAKQWYAEMDNAENYIIENAGHCANIDQPIEFNRIVKDFLDRINN